MVSLSSTVPEAETAGDELHRILAYGLLRAAYQPIVDLDTREVVGYEALARGPEDSALHLPAALFAAAAEAGLERELEWACRSAAIRGALEAGLPRSVALFVNVEPSMVGTPAPPEHAEVIARGERELDLVVELTERALTHRPADLLDELGSVRSTGARIALDDIGADRRTLAIMPLVDPDVLKLDMRFVQRRPSELQAAVVHAVNAQAERTGAIVVAEGIEQAAHVDTARALGARWGQGWLFGRPGPLPAGVIGAAGSTRPTLRRPAARGSGATPYELVTRTAPPRVGAKRLLYAMSRHLEERLVTGDEAAVLISTFQEQHHFTWRTAARYEDIARTAAFVGALSADMPSAPVAGVRGACLAQTEPLRSEWDVVVLDPHFAAAMVARDLGDGGDDWDRRFSFCLTYDRELVTAAARALMARIAAP